jgi:hypothetical protein
LNLTQDNTRYGTPIMVMVMVMVSVGKLLKITSVALASVGGGSAIATAIVDQTKDPQKGALMRTDTAYVLPMMTLLPLAAYTLTVTGTSDGVAFRKSMG